MSSQSIPFLLHKMELVCNQKVLTLSHKFQGSVPNRSHYKPGWQRNPTLVEIHKQFHGSKIVGGNEVIPHSYPSQVAIFIDGTYFCGGSLICKFCLFIETQFCVLVSPALA